MDSRIIVARLLIGKKADNAYGTRTQRDEKPL